MAKVESDGFYYFQDGEWEKEFVVGMNIGAGKPGYFPGEHAVTHKEYLRWFEMISDMGINTVRVYTILSPDFYNALYDFNKTTKKPIYLFQSVWVNEKDIATIHDPFAENDKILNDFTNECKTVVDVIHGNKTLKEIPGQPSGTYKKDVSEYVSAFVLGIEWEPTFVLNTDETHSGMGDFTGEYLQSKDATPFEIFLTKVGDSTISYETVEYKMQRPIAFANWTTTDTIHHPNEPNPQKEDLVSVDTNHIIATENYYPGLYSAYNVYPYYPEFINYGTKYQDYVDASGKKNPYEAYLKDLVSSNDLPLVVSEFGVPTSRAKTHTDIINGYNQGGIDEIEQGPIIMGLLQSVKDSGCAGGFIFTWQDEWFKRSWNTMDFDDPDRRPYWDNPQVSEQHFGLLAFDPGEKESVSYVDGDKSDWRGDKPLIKNKGTELYLKSDEAYVYLMVHSPGTDFENSKVFIPIDTKQNQGNSHMVDEGLNFEKSADFLCVIDGKDNSRIIVDQYYDANNFLYANKILPENPYALIKNSGYFANMNLVVNKPLKFPETGAETPLEMIETGKLQFGIANPNHSEYESQSDFYFNGDVLEIKIPWQLLNVMDPSTMKIMDDFHKTGEIAPFDVEEFSLGVAVINDEVSTKDTVKMNDYSWEAWDLPTYHERLKPSYVYLKDHLAELTD